MNKKLLLSKFSKLYPNPKSELNFKNTYQLAISVILSAQCTDKKVNEVTPSLWQEFSNFNQLAKATITKLEEIIRPINYYKTKARNIHNLAQIVSNDFAGELPFTHKQLIELPGIGNKTANVILSELGKAETFPVDTHVFRVANRLGLSRSKSVTQVEADLKKQFKSSVWRNLHHWLIFHGRRICKAQNPKCAECVLSKLCPSSFSK